MEFPERLRAAVLASGLSLGEISRRLRESGTPVSVSGLSAWQSGVSRPDRAASLRALPALERILGLPAEELRSRVGRRPRGPGRQPATDQTAWDPGTVTRFLASLDTRVDDPASPQLLSLRFRLVVGADGQQVSKHASLLVRAGAQGAHRIVRATGYERLPAPPRVVPLPGVHLGRSHADPASGLLAYELLLDDQLRPGETGLVEYVTLFPEGVDSPWTSANVAPSARELALEVQFDGRQPGVVESFVQPGGAEDEVRAALPGGTGVHQLVVLDPEPGTYGIRWDWGGAP
jgi:transcriptional regulator with XRE-family HTH domain